MGALAALDHRAPSLGPARFSPLPEGAIAEVLAQVLEALAYVHDDGLLHRDVRSANLLLGEDGSVKLADFTSSGVLHFPSDRRCGVVGFA